MIAPEGGEASGPYYYKVLKSGTVRFVESTPKGDHIIEYLENIGWFGQDKMHYLTLMKSDGDGGHTLTYRCDFLSVHGYDRGVRLYTLMKRMWSKL